MRKTITAFSIILFTLVAMVFCASYVQAAASQHQHEGYAGLSDPVTGYGCCGGGDCAAVPLDVDWVTPVKDGFQVDLTVEQAKLFNNNATQPIHVMVPFARVLTSLNKATGSPSLYHICIWGDQLKCLFVVSST